MDKSPDAFRTISEVADWLQTPAHVLRFWESKFAQVKPVKRAGGRRYYRPADMLLLGGIKKLLHDDGMTIKGVQKILREQGVRHVARLSVRQLEGAEAEAAADFGPEAEIEDAPFVEVEAPEPEERLIAFPSSASRPPTPKPDLPPDPPPTPEPDLPGGPEDVADATAFGPGDADELPAEGDAPRADGFAGSAQAEPAGASSDALSTLVDAPSDEDPAVADDIQDEPALDAQTDEPEVSAWAADMAAEGAPDQDEAWDATATETESLESAAADAWSEAQLPDADQNDMHAADMDDEAGAEPFKATMPQSVPPATKPGAMGRLAWLETLSDEQSDAVRAALPALRALHERLSASTAGER